MSGLHMVSDKTIESISVKPVRVREVYVNPLRNPISSLHQWTALKAKDKNGNEDIEIGSYQRFLKKGCSHVNHLLNPVSDIHEWRALLANDTKPLMTESLPQGHSLKSNPSLKEFDDEVAVDASLSCWLSSSDETTNTK